MEGLRVLLFGATGFLGGAVSQALMHDARVSLLTRAGSSVSAPEPPAGWVRHDLMAADAGGLVDLLGEVRPDVVVNCVGRLNGTHEQLVTANVDVPARLLDAIAAFAPATRFVSIGSAAEYGVVPRNLPVDEGAPARPIGEYGVTKLAATQLVECATRAGRVDGVVLRVFNPIGPGVPTESLLGRASFEIRSALTSGRDEITLGPLDAFRDFVDIRDVAEAVREAALVDEVGHRGSNGAVVLNVGSGRATCIRAAVSRLAAVSGFTGRIRESDPPPGRSAAVDWIAADVRRIGECLKWAPSHDLEASVEAVWAA